MVEIDMIDGTDFAEVTAHISRNELLLSWFYPSWSASLCPAGGHVFPFPSFKEA
jgi:hypothetical protein